LVIEIWSTAEVQLTWRSADGQGAAPADLRFKPGAGPERAYVPAVALLIIDEKKSSPKN
jgi:hypothetical protein